MVLHENILVCLSLNIYTSQLLYIVSCFLLTLFDSFYFLFFSLRTSKILSVGVFDKAYLCLYLLGILCYFLAIFSLLIVQLSVLALRAFRWVILFSIFIWAFCTYFSWKIILWVMFYEDRPELSSPVGSELNPDAWVKFAEWTGLSLFRILAISHSSEVHSVRSLCP